MSAQNDDSIGVGLLRVASDAPAVRCLGELLLVHHHEKAVNGKPFHCMQNQALTKYRAVTDLTNLEGNVSVALYEPRQLYRCGKE